MPGLFLAMFTACSTSPSAQLQKARGELADADYDQAMQVAQNALSDATHPAVTWGLELVRLEAAARAGNGQGAKMLLEGLAQAYPDQVGPTFYQATADQLKAAGDGTTAIEVLDMGAQRFPMSQAISTMIDRAASTDDPAELERLRSLGYVD